MLGQLLAAFGTAAIRGEIQSTVSRLRLRAILIGAAAAMWLLAIGFALAAFTVWLAGQVGPIAACLILAAVFAAIAIGAHVAMIMLRRRGTPLTTVLSRAMAPLKQAADEGATGSKPGEAASVGSLLVLAAAGYVLGRYLTDRDAS